MTARCANAPSVRSPEAAGIRGDRRDWATSRPGRCPTARSADLRDSPRTLDSQTTSRRQHPSLQMPRTRCPISRDARVHAQLICARIRFVGAILIGADEGVDQIEDVCVLGVRAEHRGAEVREGDHANARSLSVCRVPTVSGQGVRCRYARADAVDCPASARGSSHCAE